MPKDIELHPNPKWDNEWTLQFAHNIISFVGYDTCAYIVPMPYAYPKTIPTLQQNVHKQLR
jgi:hypothetical protein